MMNMEDTTPKTTTESTAPAPAETVTVEEYNRTVASINQMRQTLDLLASAVKDDAKYNALKSEIIGIRDLLTARAESAQPAPPPSKFKPPAPDPNKW